MALRTASKLCALHSAVLRSSPSPAAALPPALFPPRTLVPALEVQGFGLHGALPRAGTGRRGSRAGEATFAVNAGQGGVARASSSGSSGNSSSSRTSSRSGSTNASRTSSSSSRGGSSSSRGKRGNSGERRGGGRLSSGRSDGARGRRRQGGERGPTGCADGENQGLQRDWGGAYEKGTWGGEKLGTWAKKKLQQGYGWRAKAAVKEWELMEARWMQEDRERLIAEFNVVGGRRRNGEFLRLMESATGGRMREGGMERDVMDGDSIGSDYRDSAVVEIGRDILSDSTEGSSSSSSSSSSRRERVYRAVEIDRAAFVRKFVVPGLRVPPASCGPLVKQLAAAGCLLDWPRLKNVARVAGDGGDGGVSGDEARVVGAGEQEVEGRGVEGGEGVEAKRKGDKHRRGDGPRDDESTARVEFLGTVPLPDGLPWRDQAPRSTPPLHATSHSTSQGSRQGKPASRILLLREELLHTPVHMLPPVLQTILGTASPHGGTGEGEHAPTGAAAGQARPCDADSSEGGQAGRKDGGSKEEAESTGERDRKGGGREGMVEGAEMVACGVTVGYEYWTAEDVLTHVLPSHVPVPTSFESVGHIAHLNLLDVHLPYKHLIAQVLLDKHKPRILSVVNKTAAIHAVYRTMKLELLAGSFRLVTTARESGLAFKVDFARVYWNSRLATERARLVSTFSSSDVVCDVFAGVGPIAIAAAKRVKRVYANDLNPSALTFLAQNIIANRVEGKVEIFNLDGRDFIRHLLSLPRPVQMSRVVMNLPADAIEFLDVLKGAFPLAKWGTRTPPPIVHVYAFSKAADPELDLSQRIWSVLGHTMTDIDFHRVRLVAPSKWMVCCSFRLPPTVAFDSW
ncbi:hypothetical protein CLOM_g13015 [Closterium sp. NIES-68]|nr:hypothetical protein CLOM_g13015 [Closterium sp. NIES-68]